MKLAFNGKGHYTDFSESYDLYVKRSRGGDVFDERTFRRVVRSYCRILSERLIRDGIADLPCNMGTIVAARITRKPQYRGKEFIGYGKKDWKTGEYDGKLKTFGLVFLPKHGKNENLRCFGYVANRKLFQKVKSKYESDERTWELLDFNDDMI